MKPCRPFVRPVQAIYDVSNPYKTFMNLLRPFIANLHNPLEGSKFRQAESILDTPYPLVIFSGKQQMAFITLQA